MRKRLMTLAVALLVTGGSSTAAAPFDPVVTVTSTVTIGSGGADDWWGRASIKRRSSDNALVMAYYRAPSHFTNDGALHIRFSDDDGATWTAEDTKLGGGAVSGFPMNPSDADADEDAGEPWLYVAPNGDLLLHMWRVNYADKANGTYQSRSTDGGESWSTSAQIDFSGIADDAKIFATDDDFVYDRVIYAAARQYDDAIPTNAKNILVKSTDSGVSWSYISDISSFTTDTVEVGIEYVGNSTMVVVLRSLTNDNTYITRSTDMGATWAALTNVNATIGVSGRHRIYTRSHLQGLAGWWKDPMLFMVGFENQTPGSSQDRRNCIWISPDRGITWDGPHYVDVAIEDAGYGDLFWDHTNDRLGMVSYQGTLAAASLKQYNLTLSGL